MLLKWANNGVAAGFQFIAAQRSAVPFLLHVLVIGAATLFCAWFLSRSPLRTSQSFAPGSVDDRIAQGFHVAEVAGQGQSIRWTDGDSTLILLPQGFGAHELRLSLSAPRAAADQTRVSITVNGAPALITTVPAEVRRYRVLVAADHVRSMDNAVRIQSDTFLPSREVDDRLLGVAVFEVGWRSLAPQRWLVVAQVIVIGLAMGMLYVLLLQANIPFWPRLLVLVLFAAILLAMRHSDSRFVYRWNAIIMTLGLVAVLAVSLGLIRRAPPSALAPLRCWVRQHWQAGAGYVVVTVVMLHQLILHLTTQIIGTPGDNLEYLWKMQWFRDTLIRSQTSPVFTPQIFYPFGSELTISEITPAHTLLGLPLTWLFGPITSYNLVIIASFLLTAFFTYLLALRIGAPRGAAWVAGIIFAFSLRRYYHVLGHLGMMGTQWVALALYGWEGVLTRRRMWDGFVAGVGLALAAWSTWHYGATLPLLIACYTLVRPGMRGLLRLVHCWRPIVLAGAISVALVLPLAQPYAEAQSEGATARHGYSELRLHSAEPYEYLLQNMRHPLWGQRAGQYYIEDTGEHYVALGWSVIALAVAGLVIGRKQPIVQALLAIALINIIITFGPELLLPNGMRVKMPVTFIWQHVPVLDHIRSWTRMAMYVVLCAALLASVALAALPRRWYQVGWAAAGGLVLIEMASVVPLYAPGARPVDLWLREQPGRGAVAYMPDGFSGASKYSSLITGKPIIQGTGKFLPPGYQSAERELVQFPREVTLRLFQRWQVDYIVVNEAEMERQVPGWRRKLARQPLVVLAYRDAEYSVYRLLR